MAQGSASGSTIWLRMSIFIVHILYNMRRVQGLIFMFVFYFLLLARIESNALDECDVAIGTRTGRNDPYASRLASGLFWGLYCRLVVHDMPEGGVDVFGDNRIFRDQLLRKHASHFDATDPRGLAQAVIQWLALYRDGRHPKSDGMNWMTWKQSAESLKQSLMQGQRPRPHCQSEVFDSSKLNA
jgi:hypothetical protein